MSKIYQYQRGREYCLVKAAMADCRELQQIWESLGENYAFLIELESRPHDAFGISVVRTEK